MKATASMRGDGTGTLFRIGIRRHHAEHIGEASMAWARRGMRSVERQLRRRWRQRPEQGCARCEGTVSAQRDDNYRGRDDNYPREEVEESGTGGRVEGPGDDRQK
jgi:hypothetical protein